MEHGVGLGRERRHDPRIADVALHDLELRVGDEVKDRLHAEHQAVEEDHLVPGVQQDGTQERSDVAGSAGDEMRIRVRPASVGALPLRMLGGGSENFRKVEADAGANPDSPSTFLLTDRFGRH